MNKTRTTLAQLRRQLAMARTELWELYELAERGVSDEITLLTQGGCLL
jgi:hypothetical protein